MDKEEGKLGGKGKGIRKANAPSKTRADTPRKGRTHLGKVGTPSTTVTHEGRLETRGNKPWKI